ncbi:type II secretion system F family protein [Halomicroarcula sp. S1AR25-4]|uniref:type II secretion system F family protein n=1 Tax=Haloarcula sp. S1AR25-4 TaxID=2950538 RepID=UPI002876006B|nr:type II secretion system F family protein [Halomicroarcula sp. S1AR25-4]MDS0276855.1 type II secretion system F family protein [Halomicroarcula sp. S1AR25-4]
MALNPLGLAPLAVVVGILGIVGLASVDDGVDRRLTRLSRRLFGRYVTVSTERERQLEAAYIGQTYRGYAARTFLYTGLAAIGGAVVGAYTVGGFLLAVPAIVDLLMGLPPTMVAAFGIRGFELVLTSTQTLLVLIGSGVAGGVLAAALTYTLRWELPKNTAEVRQRNIDEGMTRTIAFMYALSRGGIAFPEVMGLLARNDEIYGDTAREMAVAVREMDIFGRDMISAIERMSNRTPSDRFETFAENLSSVLQSGQSLSTFLRNQYERHHEEAAERQADLLESLATIAEAYVTIFVAGVLFLITILLVFGLTTSDTLGFLQMLAYLAIPLANVGFMVYLSQTLDALGIGDGGNTDVLDREQTATLGRPAAPRDRTGLTDGGVVPGTDQNWGRLQFHDRLRSVRRVLRSPTQTLLWNPTHVLYIAVPVAVVSFAVRAPAAFQTSVVNVRLLDDLVVQSVLLVLGSFAVVRTLYSRRIRRIEDATPELLERLASLNEAGMTFVESIRRVRGSDVGVLSPEIDRIWADIQMGANVDDALVRFGRRIRTVSVTRVVTLLTNAMRASGQLGPVLRIAATQSRADRRLRNRRRQQMLTYLVVIYVSFLVFLVIIVAVQEVLVPALPSSVPTPPSGNRLGVGTDQFARLGQIDKAAYTLVFFHTALIQAVLTGFIGGQLGEGTLKDGAKHAAVLLGVAYVAFVLLSSPVASLTVDQPTVQSGELTVDSASLSSGGFVVVHAYDADGEVIGVSPYLEPGTHRDVAIQVDDPPASGRTVVLVVHQDTNGNGLFDYDFGTPGGPDAPYPAPGQQNTVAIEVELR